MQIDLQINRSVIYFKFCAFGAFKADEYRFNSLGFGVFAEIEGLGKGLGGAFHLVGLVDAGS